MAARFWVGGTGTWDGVTTTHWATTSGGAGGAAVPTTTDDVTFDANSGASAVITVNTTVSVQSITMDALVGTLDFSVNNNNVTLAGSTGLSANGSAIQTLKLGSGTFTFSGPGTANLAGSSLTLTGGTATLVFSAGANGTQTVNVGSGKTVNAVTLTGTTPGSTTYNTILAGGGTITTFTVGAGRPLRVSPGDSITATTLNVNGTSSAPVLIYQYAAGFTGTINVTSATIAWAGMYGITWTGAPTATNSLDFGQNSGITITAPSGGGSTTAFVIGG